MLEVPVDDNVFIHCVSFQNIFFFVQINFFYDNMVFVIEFIEIKLP